MPDVFASACPWADCIAHGGRRKFRQGELHDHRCDLSRVHADCFLPPKFVRFGWNRRSAIGPPARITCERLPLNQLHIHKMEVNGVRVPGEVHDLPHLRGSRIRILRAGRHVGLSPGRQTLVVEPVLGKGSHILNQAAHVVEILIQRQRSIGHTMEWECSYGRIPMSVEKARLISAQEICSQLHVDIREPIIC